jgi:hypothetical protein
MNDTEPDFFEIKYRFGTLIVDEDIYYRIVKDKSKRPYYKYKTINCINYSTKAVRCRIASGKTYSLTRLLMQPAKNEMVDHINRNALDNRRSNLRIVNPRQNSLNKTAKNSTGLIGVSTTTLRGKKRLRATFKPAGRRLCFSLYDNPFNRIICALAHDKFVIQSGDEEYAPLNYPILKNEPFRNRLLKMDIGEFRKNNIEFFIKRLGVKL